MTSRVPILDTNNQVPLAKIPDLPASKIQALVEFIEDTMAAIIGRSSNTGVTVAYVDNGAGLGTLSFTATGGTGGLDAEGARDAVNAQLLGTNGVSIAVNDPGDTVTFSLSGVPISVITGLQTALDAKAAKLDTINTQTSTAYTLALGDGGTDKLLLLNNAAANTVTVPPNSSVAFPVGTHVPLGQLGAGATTIAAGVGVTITVRGNFFKLAGQGALAELIKIGTDTWLLTGDLIA